MSDQEFLVDFSEFDPNRVIADQTEIQKFIPQRFEMAQIDGILFEDEPGMRGVGYKDVTDDEFWVRGHMPGFPLMPGVVMCECAAQVVAYFAARYEMFDNGVVGFGGLNNVRFRSMVVPGDRLIIMIARRRFRRNALVSCRFQGFVKTNLVVEGDLTGIILPESVFKGVAGA